MTRDRLLTGVAIAAMLAAIVAGLIVSGSPQRQRELRFDERRVSDLRGLSNAVSRHYRETRRLPETLERLVDGMALSAVPRDPGTNEAYEYEIDGPRDFHLCATFLRASPNSAPDEFWNHPDGRHCFRFDFSSMRFD